MFTVPKPDWDSNIARIVLDLEKLRTKQLHGEVPPSIFFQLKKIFQMLETLGSARIEGNNTTLSEYIERVIEQNSVTDEKGLELANIEKAIDFIEAETNESTKIDRSYLSELHKIVTYQLTPPPKGEGSHYPGELRKNNVTIKGARHTLKSRTKCNDICYGDRCYEGLFSDYLGREVRDTLAI